MSSPVVETARTIPLIIEHGNHIPIEDEEISGFPFDRDSDRDGHFRSQLDDIAKRHPEFAEHLGNFSLRSSPRRQSSGGTEDAADLHRRFERPFGGHFERFGFPFDRDDFDPEQYTQQFYQQPQQEYYQPEPSHQPQQQNYQKQSSYQQQPTYQQQPSYQQQTSYQQQPTYQQPQPEYQENQQQQSSQPQNTENPPPAPERDRNNIQQSNTIDLGQKQEPVNERNQRSMSAPPTEKGQGQRFTSSIKIPVNQPTSESENMAAQPQQQQSDARTTERIIPIRIEGRDEPVLPRNAPSSYSQPRQTFNASPQPERIFGHRPEQFTQFVDREPGQYEKWQSKGFEPMRHAFSPEELLRQQRFPRQNATPTHFPSQQRRAASPQQAPPQPAKEEIPIPVQREAPQPKQQVPQQQAAPPQQPPQPPKPAPQQQKPLTPIDQIQAIQKDVSALMEQVQQFAGQPKDKQYLYLDEMLTRNLLKLDNIDTQGQETIRSARKEAIKCIEKAIGVLEAKAASNVEPPKTGDSMEVEKPQEASVEIKETVEGEKKDGEAQPMETEPAVPNTTEKVEGSPQPMEIATTEPSASGETKPSAEVAEKVEIKPETATVETKAGPQIENKAEGADVKEETCEAQESNLPVAEAVKKFEGSVENKEKEESDAKKDNSKPEESTGASQGQVEAKAEEKKEKKKGKKKTEKKEK